ncbi:MAG: ABC transporter ATP-binding protein [Verrucomicrobiota bacterium]
MDNFAIKVENLGKKYRIHHLPNGQKMPGYSRINEDVTRLLKSPFKFLSKKAHETHQPETDEDFWALKNIDVTIHPGERIGLIGRNGAGKSTFLKTLSRIVTPSTGKMTIQGRLASLLEVGTGFHPELTGRENIFLNGSILGMPRKEIGLKFDQIVEFSGVERFLDTPVKRYSSGMYVRLAFSVAAHLDSEILIVDEVLAVGDKEFQAKSLKKMRELTQEEDRTIIFVSHDSEKIRNLCGRVIVLKSGQVLSDTTDVNAGLELLESEARKAS